MRLALGKVAKGESARLMSDMAKACVAECGPDAVEAGVICVWIRVLHAVDLLVYACF